MCTYGVTGSSRPLNDTPVAYTGKHWLDPSQQIGCCCSTWQWQTVPTKRENAVYSPVQSSRVQSSRVSSGLSALRMATSLGRNTTRSVFAQWKHQPSQPNRRTKPYWHMSSVECRWQWRWLQFWRCCRYRNWRNPSWYIPPQHIYIGKIVYEIFDQRNISNDEIIGYYWWFTHTLSLSLMIQIIYRQHDKNIWSNGWWNGEFYRRTRW